MSFSAVVGMMARADAQEHGRKRAYSPPCEQHGSAAFYHAGIPAIRADAADRDPVPSHRVSRIAGEPFVAVPLFSIVTVPFTLTGLAAGGSEGSVGTRRTANCSDKRRVAAGADRASSTFALRRHHRCRNTQGFGWLIVFMPSLLILLPRRWPGRRLALLAVAALLLQSPGPPGKGCVDVHVLDVGQAIRRNQ